MKIIFCFLIGKNSEIEKRIKKKKKKKKLKL